MTTEPDRNPTESTTQTPQPSDQDVPGRDRVANLVGVGCFAALLALIILQVSC